MSDQPQGVVIEEIPAAVAPVKPTLAEAAEVLSPKEVELAVKQGDVVDPAKKPEEQKPGDKKPEAKKPEEKTPEKNLESKEEIEQKFQEAFVDPEKQRELLKTLSKSETILFFQQKGLYGRMKTATEKKQAAEAERDHIAMKAKAQEEKIAKLEEENKNLKAKPAAPAKKGEPKLDIFGNPIVDDETDPKKQPVTKEDLKEIEKKKAEDAKKKEDEAEEQKIHAAKLVTILNAQQAEAAEKYDGFDKELELAVAIMQKGEELEEMFPDKKQASKARKLIVDFVYASRNADKFKDGDYNAADIAHDLATMHPEYGKPDGGGKADPNKNGGLDPKKAAKIVDNAGKRNSSASLPTGGGKKFVPYEEMTVEQLADLSAADFAKVPKAIRDKFLRET